MIHTDPIAYLTAAGFHYKPAESPDVWTHLESHFDGPHRIGPKFNQIPSSTVADLIATGEEALLEALVEHHRLRGMLGRIMQVIDLPYIVGTDAVIPLAEADKDRILSLIDHPGTPVEHIIRVMPVEADAIPCTRQATISGGVYADGHTVGYYDLHPGNQMKRGEGDASGAYLATPDEIKTLAAEMERRLDDIVVVTLKECEDMLSKVTTALG